MANVRGMTLTRPVWVAGSLGRLEKMTPEARKVIRDAKRGIMRCKRMNAELDDRIARLHQIDLAAAATDNADQLHMLLRAMQAPGPADKAELPEAA